MFQNKKKYFLLALLLLLFWNFYENQNVEIRVVSSRGETVKYAMPRKDKRKIESFFYFMFIEGEGAYTLFGAKPMTVNAYLTPLATSDWMDFISSLFPCNLKTHQGWQTWQQYQHQFPMVKFAMWEEKNTFRSEPNQSKMIILVHKQKLQETINDFHEDFQAVLGEQELTSEVLLQRAKNATFLEDVLHSHQGLIGTIFGFGRDNAWLFEEKKQGKVVPLSYVWRENQEIQKFYETRSCIRWTYLGIPSNDVSCLSYPGFLADLNSIETQNIQKKIIQTRSEIINFYKGKDLVEATLSILINEGVPLK
jgi:hypothetical protein